LQLQKYYMFFVFLNGYLAMLTSQLGVCQWVIDYTMGAVTFWTDVNLNSFAIFIQVNILIGPVPGLCPNL